MTRPLRIEYAGAVYHVMNRGGSGRQVFQTDSDYQLFFDLLKESIDQWNIVIHAFSLMPNHYHMLIETPLGNLQRAMRHINGVYTQRYNRAHKKDGHLFRGRYKAILVEDDAYMVELLRYIHMNPVKAKIAKKPQDHRWTSHRYYLGGGPISWLTSDRLLEYFGKRLNLARRKLHEFVMEGVPEELERRLQSSNWPSVFSSDNFEDWVKWNFVKGIKNREIKYECKRPVEISEKSLIKIISAVMDMSWIEIINAKGRGARLVRGIAIRFFRRYLKYDYARLSSIFGGIHSTNISRSVGRMPEGFEDKWARLEIEIQNAKRQTLNAKR